MPSQTLNLCPHKLHLACWEERRAARVAQDRTRQSTLAKPNRSFYIRPFSDFAPTPEASGFFLLLALALGGASRRATGGRWAAPPQALGCRTRRWCPMASVPTLPPCLACASPRIQRCRQEPARTRRHTATRRQRSQRLSTVGTWLDWQAHGWVWCAALLLVLRDRVLTSGSPHLPYRLTQKSHRKRRLESAPLQMDLLPSSTPLGLRTGTETAMVS